LKKNNHKGDTMNSVIKSFLPTNILTALVEIALLTITTFAIITNRLTPQLSTVISTIIISLSLLNILLHIFTKEEKIMDIISKNMLEDFDLIMNSILLIIVSLVQLSCITTLFLTQHYFYSTLLTLHLITNLGYNEKIFVIYNNNKTIHKCMIELGRDYNKNLMSKHLLHKTNKVDK